MGERMKNIGSRSFRLRDFIKAAAGIAMPYIVPASALGLGGAVAPSERIGLGVVGLGIRGKQHLKSFLQLPQCQILAVSDLFDSRREFAKNLVETHYAKSKSGGTYNGCDTYNDFRELLSRDDIDAVVVATPEFWHALVGVAAVKAGKDVYGEKGLTLTVAEGRVLVDTVRRYGSIFQVGTQQRSGRNFRFACELARNGYLGDLHTVKVGVPGGQALGNAPEIAVPDGFDYERWLGPAPVAPYNAIRCTSPGGWYHIYDYCAGWIQAWGVHHMDIALWGAPELLGSPLEIEGTAVFPDEGLGNTSLTWDVNFTTAKGLRLSFTDNAVHPQGCRFEGSKGWVHVNRKGISAEPASLLTADIKPGEEHLYESRGHWVNFLECVRNRRDPVAPVEAGHEATTATLLADIATRLGRKLTWDWKAEKFINNPIADRMLSRAMRSPWRL